MSTAQQLGLIGNSIKVQSLPTASAETFGAGNRFYTLIGQQEGYITGHTYHTVVANDVYSWEDVACGNYNMLDNIPVINQDLTASDFTPVANTYYRHTGSTTATFTQGVIYCYDGTEYKALDGAGGISDVKVNGASVVTDGVANIPAASETRSGVMTTGDQSFTGTKTITSSVSDGVVLRLKRPKPSSGRSYAKMKFYGITSSGSEYPFLIGTTSLTTFSFVQSFSYSGTYFNFSNYNNESFEIYLNTGGYSPAGHVNCGTSRNHQLYLMSKGYYNAVPMSEGTLMSTPKTWSSGTSGSVTLPSSGTYQIYMNDGKNNKNFGVVYWDGSTDTYTQVVMDSAHSGYFATIVGGVITAFDVNLTADSTTANTNTIYYRKIGE